MLLPVAAADIHRVELVRIPSSREWDEWVTIPGKTLASAEGAHAAAIAGLVAALPDGESMRCFSPGYALKAHSAEGVLFEIAFCFSCHNALVIVPGGARSQLLAFDPDSPAGKELLARFRAAGQPETVPRRGPA
jgi:hypothetical protein